MKTTTSILMDDEERNNLKALGCMRKWIHLGTTYGLIKRECIRNFDFQSFANNVLLLRWCEQPHPTAVKSGRTRNGKTWEIIRAVNYPDGVYEYSTKIINKDDNGLVRVIFQKGDIQERIDDAIDTKPYKKLRQENLKHLLSVYDADFKRTEIEEQIQKYQALLKSADTNMNIRKQPIKKKLKELHNRLENMDSPSTEDNELLTNDLILHKLYMEDYDTERIRNKEHNAKPSVAKETDLDLALGEGRAHGPTSTTDV